MIDNETGYNEKNNNEDDNHQIETSTEPLIEDDNRQSGLLQEDDSRQDERGLSSTGDQTANSEQEDKKLRNWNDLRLAKERAEKERDDALRFINQMKNQQNDSRQENSHKDELSLKDDDLAEGKHVNAVKKEAYKKIAAIETQLTEQRTQLIEQRIKQQYPDFEEIVNPDTLSQLREADPELSETILSNSNYYSQLITAYRSIKRYGLIGNNALNKQKEKALYNASKPKSTSAVSPQQGETPLSRANAFADGLTPELKKQLWKEMQEIRKQT